MADRRAEALPGRLSGRLLGQGTGRHDTALCGHGERPQETRRPGAGRRVRQGSRRLRDARRARSAGARRSAGGGGPRAERDMRSDLLRQLASRVHVRGARCPDRSRDRPADRGVRAAAGRAGRGPAAGRASTGSGSATTSAIRRGKRSPARIVLDEIARREDIAVESGEVDAEIEKYAAAMGRPAGAVKARLEKEGRISSLYTSLRREKAVDFLRSRATIAEE